METQEFDPMTVRKPEPPAEAVKAAAKAISKKAKTKATPDEPAGQPEAFSLRETGGDNALGVARDQLRSFVERIERLEEEKSTIATDIKDVYGEAKGTGFDAKVLRKVIQIRKQDKDERMEQEAILDTYLHALGMIAAPAEG